MVLEKLRLLAILLHGDDRVGEHRVAVVSRRLPNSGPALYAESCPVRQVPAEEHGEGMGISRPHREDKPGAAEVQRREVLSFERFVTSVVGARASPNTVASWALM